MGMIQHRKRAFFFALALVGTAACASGDSSSTATGTADTATGDGDGDGDGQPGAIAACALNQDKPDGNCQGSELDFGVVDPNTFSLRLLRVDNTTDDEVRYLAIDFDDNARFETTVVRYQPNPALPSQLERFETTFPVTRDAGESMWFEILFEVGKGFEVFPSNTGRVIIEVAGEQREVPFTTIGEFEGCPLGTADCDGDPATGCETDIETNDDNCGACANQCALESGEATCINGECRIDRCADGRADCDDDDANGCETSTETVENCGACGETCEVANAVTTCAGEVCAFVECEQDYWDIDGDLCVACGAGCPVGAECDPYTQVCRFTVSGDCVIIDSDPEATNGCE